MRLLAATPTDAAWKDIVIACSLLIGALIVLYVGLSYYRRNWLRGGEDGASTPWTLEGLRQLREQGAITEEEYEKMRVAMIGAVRSEVTEPDDGIVTPDNDVTTEK